MWDNSRDSDDFSAITDSQRERFDERVQITITCSGCGFAEMIRVTDPADIERTVDSCRKCHKPEPIPFVQYDEEVPF
jgi:predicted nucleic-acid-binding Zn-ribbon protein